MRHDPPRSPSDPVCGRILATQDNGSSARIYRLAWDDGRPLKVIGSDGGLLETPLERDTVLLGPAERVELWVDFADHPGLFLYHCHNLEHEDMGMMRNYDVRAA